MSLPLERRSFALPRAAAPDAEIVAVGDMHGRSDLLDALLDEAAREPRRLERRIVVFLGDLVDRGPDSLGVIDRARGAAARIGAGESVALMGNHEAMMRLAVDPATPPDDALDALDAWLANGGDRVIAEFARFRRPPASSEDVLEVVRATLPDRVRVWLAALRPNWRSGDLLFVHAGVNPAEALDAFLAAPWNVPLASLDSERHWSWVRWPFLEHDPGAGGWSGLFVVHGHTPNDGRKFARHADQIARFRLNLDAGSGHTGVAKMAIIRGAEADVVTVRGPTDRMLRG
jgi:serine/threonine protein phosphatase 1